MQFLMSPQCGVLVMFIFGEPVAYRVILDALDTEYSLHM